jgi:hypothetical protein
MNQTAETSIPSSTPQDTVIIRRLFTLLIAFGLGGVAVWMLRQNWAKQAIWPWLLLLFAMFFAAGTLRHLDLWLPGELILPRLAKFSARTHVMAGTVLIAGSLALTWLVVRRLLPDYKSLWHGTPLLWLLAMVLVVGGAWLLGAVGQESGRAATAFTLWSDSKRNRWLEAAAVVLILALAIFLRTYRFNSIPPGIYVDETNGALDAVRILEGDPASPFGTGWYGTPNGYIYYMAGIIKLLGASWTSLKLISLIPAVLSVLAIYFLGRLLFGPVAGLGAMLLMASSRWHLSMSRWGWNETAPPLFQILATFFLIRGLRDRRALDYALGGLFMGLSIYTYLSARLAAATILLYILLWVLTDPSGMVASLQRSWLGFVLFAVGALVAVAPMGVTYFTDPFAMNNRVSEISIYRDIRQQNSMLPFYQNVEDILRFFHQTGDHQGKHNLPDEPMTDPITGLLFAVGLAYSILHWRGHRYFLLILWLVIGLAGSFLSSHSESPQSYRALTALPAVMLMAADVLDRVLSAIHKFLQEWSFTQAHPKLPLYIAAATGLLVLFGSTAWESNVYFGRQAASLAVQQGFNPMENRVAHEVMTALQADQDVYLSPGFAEFSPLRYLVYGAIKARTGENTLDNRPYHTLLPATDLPVEDTGKDVLILLDHSYWPLRDYFQYFYPQAKMELNTLADGSPLYFRVEIPHEQIAALQGLTKSVTYPDGHKDKSQVAGASLVQEDLQASGITWEGGIRIEHGGEYDIKGQGGLDVFVDGLPVHGKQYLGRGHYTVKAAWSAGDEAGAQLLWQAPGQDWAPVPANVLFRVPQQQQGLLGTYWNNANWENAPVFHQVTPFLLLAWNEEQPIVPNGPFSARYDGMLKIAESGTYTFRVEADDGARLIIDDQVAGEGMTPGQPNSFDTSLELSAGRHPIRVEYFQQGGGTALRLFWRLGDQPLTPVPPSVFTPAQP